jgi:Reverse transcriptase (RNA-dependent DNA polymerase)
VGVCHQATRGRERAALQGVPCSKGLHTATRVDYFKVWAPTGKPAAYRAMLAYAASNDYDVNLFDIKCAFLNGDLEEHIVIRPPGGCAAAGEHWLLRKALCGLKQSARAWHAKLRAALMELGYTPSAVDPALFIRAAMPSRGATGCKCLIHTHDLHTCRSVTCFLWLPETA